MAAALPITAIAPPRAAEHSDRELSSTVTKTEALLPLARMQPPAPVSPGATPPVRVRPRTSTLVAIPSLPIRKCRPAPWQSIVVLAAPLLPTSETLVGIARPSLGHPLYVPGPNSTVDWTGALSTAETQSPPSTTETWAGSASVKTIARSAANANLTHVFIPSRRLNAKSVSTISDEARPRFLRRLGLGHQCMCVPVPVALEVAEHHSIPCSVWLGTGDGRTVPPGLRGPSEGSAHSVVCDRGDFICTENTPHTRHLV